MSLVRTARRRSCDLLAALCVQAFALSMPAPADELADFHAAVEQASAQHRVAMTTLETRSREEASAAVQQFRQTWQSIIDRFGANRPPAFANEEHYPGMLMQVDMRLVGALIVIDIGSREAAREALAPIQETLTQLRARSAPPARP
jgi:hypothetical protein